MKHWTRITVVLLAVLSLPPTAFAQPQLESLWPNDDGLSWSYTGTYRDFPDDPVENYLPRLVFDGTGSMAPGVTVQRLVGLNPSPTVTKSAVGVPPRHWPPLYRSLWWGRPDLRSELEDRASVSKADSFWPWLYLGPAEIDNETAFRKTVDKIGHWRGVIADWSWLYFDGEPFAGQSFTLQLIPDLADDVFLHVTVQSIAATVVTQAGTFEDSVILRLIVDPGTSRFTDEEGNVLGSITSQIDGWIAFAPGVGPVAMSQATTITAVDCPAGCPEEDLLGEELGVGTLSLRETPVATERSSWGEVKGRY